MASFGAGNPYGDPNWYNGVRRMNKEPFGLSLYCMGRAGLPQPLLQGDAQGANPEGESFL